MILILTPSLVKEMALLNMLNSLGYVLEIFRAHPAVVNKGWSLAIRSLPTVVIIVNPPQLFLVGHFFGILMIMYTPVLDVIFNFEVLHFTCNEELLDWIAGHRLYLLTTNKQVDLRCD